VLRFVARRALQAVVVAFAVATIAFVLIHAAPGDPLAALPGDPPELAAARESLRHAYGLDRPLAAQYPIMIWSMARGDFGVSFTDGRPVRAVLGGAIARTLLLMTPAFILGVLFGAGLGTWQGARRGRLADRAVSATSLAILSLPEFLLALLVSTTFALALGWFPATGMRDSAAPHDLPFTSAVGDVAWHAALPVATLALIIAAIVARYQRAAVAEAMEEDFVRAARARGASPRRVLVRHVLRRTLGALCAVVGLIAPALVSGQALVEMVFNWPGAGTALLSAVYGRDYPVVIGLVVVGSAAVSAATALADIGAAVANPTVRAAA
jgi:peptide/nickel transport system permease protein